MEKNIINKKIPNNKLLEMWKQTDFKDSSFVEIPNVIKMDDEEKIIVDMQYPKLGMKNSIDRCLIREEALEKLLLACTYLPKGLSFKIWDAYRSWDLQNELYYAYRPDIIKQFNLEKLPLEEQEKVISNYVSIPTKDENFPPLHTTGGSIDLTIIDLNTLEDLDLGVEFDEFSNRTNTTSYENSTNETVIKNRRLLYNIMTQVGFTNLSSEIWHYDYGNRAWAFYKNKKAIYKGIFDIKQIKSPKSFEKFIENLNSKEISNHKWEAQENSYTTVCS